MATNEEVYKLCFRDRMAPLDIAKKLDISFDEVTKRIRLHQETMNLKSIQGEW